MVAAVVVLTVDGGGAVAVGLVGGDGRFDGESQRVWTETCQTVEFMREELKRGADELMPQGLSKEKRLRRLVFSVAQPTMLGAAIAAGYVSTAEVAKELTADMPRSGRSAHCAGRGAETCLALLCVKEGRAD